MSEFAAFHDELRAVAKDVLGTTEPGGQVAEPPELDWQVVVDAGWSGLEVAESLDGAGATFAEVAVVLEELGRAAAPSPFLGTVALGVGTLDLLQPSAGRDGLLQRIAAGERTVAVAVVDGADGDGVVERADAPFRLTSTPDGLRLYGTAAFVPDAPGADRFLVLATGPDDRLVFVVVHDDQAGLDVTPQPLLDATQRVGTVVADGVEVSDAGVLTFTHDADATVRAVLDRGALAVACDALGVGAAMLDGTVAYAGMREQFGRPIGSFQAVKHQCADMLVHVSVARELVVAAVDALVRDPFDASVAVSMAKAYACDMAVDVAGRAMQLHGGIGYTWESGIHVFLKRAALDRSLFGSPPAHRRRLALRYDAAPVQPDPVQ
ncbi:MAG: acyl-CoA dehydrogenase family protein [Acidimicrobiia bacterium]